MELSSKEKQILSQIVADQESGRHLLRTEKEWEAIGISKKEYNEVLMELIRANVYFDWVCSDWDENIEKQARMLLFAKSCMNPEFDDLLKTLD